MSIIKWLMKGIKYFIVLLLNMEQNTYTQAELEQYKEIRVALQTACNAILYTRCRTNTSSELRTTLMRLNHDIMHAIKVYQIGDMERIEEVQ